MRPPAGVPQLLGVVSTRQVCSQLGSVRGQRVPPGSSCRGPWRPRSGFQAEVRHRPVTRGLRCTDAAPCAGASESPARSLHPTSAGRPRRRRHSRFERCERLVHVPLDAGGSSCTGGRPQLSREPAGRPGGLGCQAEGRRGQVPTPATPSVGLASLGTSQTERGRHAGPLRCRAASVTHGLIPRVPCFH